MLDVHNIAVDHGRIPTVVLIPLLVLSNVLVDLVYKLLVHQLLILVVAVVLFYDLTIGVPVGRLDFLVVRQQQQVLESPVSELLQVEAVLFYSGQSRGAAVNQELVVLWVVKLVFVYRVLVFSSAVQFILSFANCRVGRVEISV